MDEPDLVWIQDRLKAIGMNQAQLADALGFDNSKMSRLLNGRQNLQLDDFRRIEAIIGARSPGFAEPADTFTPQVRAVPADVGWMKGVAPDAAKPIAYRLSRPIPSLSLAPDDTLIVDTAGAHEAGALIVVNVAYEDGSAATQLRRRFGGQLVATDPFDPEPLIPEDSGRAPSYGRVVAAVRRFPT